MKKKNQDEFLKKVFPAELKEISKRRKNAGLDKTELRDTPTTDNVLAGLALSGGGIRSATFSLGVIQGLSKHGLLRHVDLLSTVSGGGYIGSCLSQLLNDPRHATEGDRFPLRYNQGSSEPPALTHLRNCSNYLSPVGLLTKLRLPNLLLRGIILNLFVFLPYIMAAVFFTELAYEKGPLWAYLPALVTPLLLLFVIMALAFPIMVRLFRKVFNWDRRNRYELLLTIPLLLVMIVLFMVPFLRITRLAIEHSTHQFKAWLIHLHSNSEAMWHFALGAFAIIVLFMLAGKASENVSRIGGKLLLWVVGLLGPAFIYAIYLGLCLWQIDSPFLPIAADQVLNQATTLKQPFKTVLENTKDEDKEAVPVDADDGFAEVMLTHEGWPANMSELLDGLAGRSLTFSPEAQVSCLSKLPVEFRADSDAAAIGCGEPRPDLYWRQDNRVWVIDNAPGEDSDCSAYTEWKNLPTEKDLKDCTYFTRSSPIGLRIEGAQLHLFDSSEDFIFLALFVGLLIMNRWLLDINITSPHGFYRDRLSKAFVFSVDPQGEINSVDNVPLSSLNAENTCAPYHILNVALNLQGSKDPDLRGRESDFFIFSKKFIGSDRTGFTETERMESYDHHVDLATAMAISGAAAAPNMGTTTSRSLTFIMTLLNIRLGYWLPNPSFVNKEHWYNRFRLSSARPKLIWNESLGKLDARGSHVNISDGGHIENLGIYPLLKRKCKFIVSVDAEADPNMTFNGLVTLMRFARIDMGIEINIDLDKLRKDSQGYSKAHWSLGEIVYANGELGQLLYIKLSVTGDEPEYIRSYRSNHPDYPHESTADQFFSEDQFEAYRALGEHCCEGMLKDVEDIGGFAGLKDKPQLNPGSV
jgi:hypothetical protein